MNKVNFDTKKRQYYLMILDKLKYYFSDLIYKMKMTKNFKLLFIQYNVK